MQTQNNSLKFIRNTLFLLVILLFSLSIISLYSKYLANENNQDSGKVTVIYTNFGSRDLLGKLHGETAPFLTNLESIREVKDDIPMCDDGFEGFLSRQRVLVVTSGMAKVKATACIMDVLSRYGEKVKEVILVGIGGITPMRGGMQNELGRLRNGESAMIGDVCINFVAFDFDLQHYSSDQIGTGSPEPVYWPQRSEFPSAYIKGSLELAEELYSASAKVEWPAPPNNVQDINTSYHGFSRSAKAWNIKECLESSSDLFWHDIRSDRQARITGATLLNKIHMSSLTPEDILVATSMEAVPVGAVVSWWNRSYGTDIPFAYVRGASNFDHVRLNTDGTPVIDGRLSIEILMASGGIEYAIETEALPVLMMLELRINQE